MTKHNILFVDDDLNVLQGLQRMLRGMRQEWEMHFVDSGASALDMLARQSFDVVVTDMRMPGMDGAELLTEVNARYPGTVRVILSGYSQEESVMRTVGPAHQYLAKPCPPQALVAVVRRALDLRGVLGAEGLRQLLAGLKSLPTPSGSYFSLVKYMDSPTASANGVAELIGQDVAMTAELLKLTNSAYFAVPAKVASPLQAVRILGFETLRALVLRIGIFRHFEGHPELVRLMEDLNRDSFLVARIAKRIARAEGLSPPEAEEAFCGGMLCSIGALAMLDQMPERFEAARAKVAAGQDIMEAEVEVFGATHTQLGAYLLGLWGFNDSVVEAVAFSGRPGATAGRMMGALAAVHAARTLAGPNPLYLGLGRDSGVELDAAYVEDLGRTERVAAWAAEAKLEKGEKG